MSSNIDKIIVNIEKTNIPILKPGKTVFNYKVNLFKPVTIIPENRASEVDLWKGIEVDFDRSINFAAKTVAYLKKANVSGDLDNGFIELKRERKGNKLVFLPDSDVMKSYKEVIEPGQTYEFGIPNAALRDDEGNINDGLVLEFTTKK